MDQTSGTHVCNVDNCGEPAVALYQWDWGEKGACCAHHQLILTQKMEHLNRRCIFSPLNLPAAPMGRDERTAAYAKARALEDEIAQVKHQAAELYNEKQALITECQRLTARNNDLTDDCKDLQQDLEALNKRLGDVTIERDNLRAEVQRVRLLIPKPADVNPNGPPLPPRPSTAEAPTTER